MYGIDIQAENDLYGEKYMPDNIIFRMEHAVVKGQQHTELEDVTLKIMGKHLTALISEDGSAGMVLKVMAGLRDVQSGKTNALELQKLCAATPEAFLRPVQYVPDDIVCYSGMTVDGFLQGMAGGSNEMMEEARRLLSVFHIEKEEMLLDMTFEQNRLVSVIQAMMAKPALLLLERPYDMLGGRTYKELLREVAARYAAGTTVVMAAEHFADVVLPCHEYIFLKEGKVIGSYERSELPRPAKVVTLWGGNPAAFLPEKMTMLERHKGYCRFLYTESNMKELAVRVSVTGCSNFNLEELSMEEMLFGDYERWRT